MPRRHAPNRRIPSRRPLHRPLRRRRPAALALAVLGGAISCGGEQAPESLLLVTFDTTRADRLGCYGYERAQTPSIDALAAEGVLFERCMAPAPITLPSHASLLTGLYPNRHGVRNNGTHRLEEELTTLAEVLAERGYATGAVVSAAVLKARYGLDQGFAYYDDRLSEGLDEGRLHSAQSPADATLQRARAWLRERGGEPFFLWVHFFDPHGDYEPPEPFASRFPASPYDGEIAFADHALGELVAELERTGRLAATLVVFTADHGESLGEHGERTHGLFVYESTVRVPLVLRHPSLAAGTRVPDVVSTVDVFPTVLELLGVALPPPAGSTAGAATDGRSLVAAARGGHGQGPSGEPPSHGRPVYAEAMYPYFNHGWSDLRSVRDGRFRFIRAPRPELYDLAADPAERRNLLARGAPGAAAAAARLASALDAILARGERGGAGAALGDERRAELEALGYVWHAAAPGAGGEPSSALPDPKDKLRSWSRYEVAMDRADAGDWEPAAEILGALFEEDRGAALVAEELSWVLVQAGRQREALEVLRAAVSQPNVTVTSRLRLAGLERKLGGGDWRAQIAAAKELDPRNPNVWATEGDCLLALGDPAAALGAYERATRLGGGFRAFKGVAIACARAGDAAAAEEALARAEKAARGSATGLFNLARLLEELGQLERAEETYREALAADPRNAEAALNLGALQLRRGRHAAAEESLRRAVAVDPRTYGAHFNLGLLLLDAGRPEEAVVPLEEAVRLRPGERSARMKLLEAYRAAGRPADALGLAQSLLEETPEHVGTLAAAAVAAARLGLADEARRYAARALAADRGKAERAAARNPEFGALFE